MVSFTLLALIVALVCYLLATLRASPFTEQLTQKLCVIGAIPPTNHAAATDYSCAAADMSKFTRVIAYYNLGTAGASANMQGYFIASANANMVGNTNVAAAVPLTSNNNTANRVESLELRADQMPAGTRYCLPVLLVNTAALFSDCLFLGEATYHPASQFNTTNVLDQASVT